MVILTLAFGTIVSMLLPILNAIVALLRDARDHPPARPRHHGPIGRADAGDDDRAGRRASTTRCSSSRATSAGLQDGLELDESIARAAATSGGAVFFAGGTVTIALVSLAVAGIPLVTTMGLMAAIAVVVAVLAALTLLPAVLAIAGPRINSLRVRAASRPAPERDTKEGLWAKWANDIAKHPLIAGLAALAILLPLTIPLLSLNLGQQDTAALSTSTTARKAYDLITESFGPGVNGPLIVAVSLGLARRTEHRRDPRLQTLAEGRRRRTAGRRGGHAGPDRQGGHDRLLQRDRHHRAGGESDRRTRRTAALERDPQRRAGHRHARRHRRQHRRLRRPGLEDLRKAAAADPRRDRAQLRAADPRVPHAS